MTPKDIEVLMTTGDISYTEYGSQGKLSLNRTNVREEFIPAESLKFAKNGSVYANIGDYYECDSYWPKWFKKGEWKYIKDNKKDNSEIT